MKYLVRKTGKMSAKQYLFFLCFMALFFSSYGQTAMTFREAESKGKPFQFLDSLYKSAVHSNVDLAVFKSSDEQLEVQKSYTALIRDLAVFLKTNDFVWEKPTRCFNRIYFNPEGRIDYFLFNFAAGQITPEKEKEFGRLLNLFVVDYEFSLKANENFAQCSPIRYIDL